MPSNDLRLLALDGGGVRGLSSLMILEQLMETVNPDAPPKPCDYFDMIGGTSTGGLIAVMLGRLKMSIAECIDAYLSLSDRVFRQTRHRVTIKGKIQGRFDSEELVRAVRDVIKRQGLQEEALLKDAPEADCKVFVCATSKETSETVCLTSYRARGNSDLVNSVKIWEACRATSAASSFFDPIAVGRYKEEFVDGATGANNPVREVWDQAQQVWGPEPLEGKVKCLVSIGTGVPSLKPFKDDAFHIGETLVAIATETEQTAERFRREKSLLDGTGRYYRFNVARGLEGIGLEEAKMVKEIAAATRRYIASQEVYQQMQACAGNITGRAYFGKYKIIFSLEGVPRASQFVDRPTEMAELERVLLPRPEQDHRQKIHVVHGLGGIGKTQLAVEFMRRHHGRFSSVFWLDGQREDSLKRSIASYAGRIPQGQITEMSRAYAADGSVDIDTVVMDVMSWLARPDNTAWLLVIDNVDREYNPRGGDPDAYDVKRFLSGADHGSVLITSRLARLEQLGESQQLGKVSKEQGQAILQNRYKRKYGKLRLVGEPMRTNKTDIADTDAAEGERLLELLDGLPLAIAQAGAYLQESRVGIAAYLSFYKQQWIELMSMRSETDAPLQDYPDRSVWTTWAISYQAIREKHEPTANLLLLWSFLDNKDLWYGLFAAACRASIVATEMLSKWVGEIARSELEFTRAMQLLRNYSLIEEMEELTSYATHPVVHRWAYYYQGKRSASQLGQLAVITVGWAVPHNSTRDYSAIQRRLLFHAQAGFQWVVESQKEQRMGIDKSCDKENDKEQRSFLGAMYGLGHLYSSQGKLAEAEQMYTRALRGYEEALGSNHTSTLDSVHSLANLYMSQGKLAKAEQMYEQVLRGYEEALGPNHTSTLLAVNNLGLLYVDQGKLAEAEQMYERALRGYEKALGPNHTSTLRTVNNLGSLYREQGRLAEAEQMYQRALRGREEALGSNHTSTLNSIHSLANLYKSQGKLVKAEQMYEQVLRGYGEALGPNHTSTLLAVNSLGSLYRVQGKLAEAEQMYERALRGYEEALGSSHTSTLNSVHSLANLYKNQGKLVEAEQMYERALRGYEEALGPNHTSTLLAVNNLGLLYEDQDKLAAAEQMYERALRGYEKALGPNHTSTLRTVNNLGSLYRKLGKLAEAEQMYQRALQGRKEALGSNHTSTLDSVHCLANLYKSQGKPAEAEQMYEQVLRGYEEALGPNHTSVLLAANNLGLLYVDQGKLAEAEQMYQRALRGREEALGSNHTSTLDSVHCLANLYKNQGKLAEAKQMYKRALRGYEEARGPNHTSTLRIAKNLSLCEKAG